MRWFKLSFIIIMCLAISYVEYLYSSIQSSMFFINFFFFLHIGHECLLSYSWINYTAKSEIFICLFLALFLKSISLFVLNAHFFPCSEIWSVYIQLPFFVCKYSSSFALKSLLCCWCVLCDPTRLTSALLICLICKYLLRRNPNQLVKKKTCYRKLFNTVTLIIMT